MDKSKVVGRSKKIDPDIWKGPFKIIRKISDLLFELKGKPGTKVKIVHHDRLKPYVSRQTPYCALPQTSDNRIDDRNAKQRTTLQRGTNKYINKPCAGRRTSGRKREQTHFFQAM